MPILILLSLIAACLPLPWPDYYSLGPRGSVLATSAVLAFSLLLSSSLSLWVIRRLAREPNCWNDVIRGYGRLRHLLFFFNLGITAFALVFLGWGHTVWSQLVMTYEHRQRLLPFAELAAPAPYLLLLVLNWIIYYPAERALHRHDPHGTRKPFWSLPAYILFNAQRFALMVMFPVSLTVTHQTLSRYVPWLLEEWWFQLSAAVLIVVVIIMMPVLARLLLGLRRLPAGPRRDWLESTARRLQVRISDLLIWRTGGSMANAMVLGLIPRARYVIVTDRLLEGLDTEELGAVLGHELGHARSGHIPYYFLFFMLSGVAILGLYTLLIEVLKQHNLLNLEGWEEALALPPLLAMGVYLFLVFGYLSRVCERQADIAGCRAVSCSNTDCYGHNAETVFPVGGQAICRTGVRAMIRALEGVQILNGMDEAGAGGLRQRIRGWIAWVKSWQHGPPNARINYLARLLTRPELAARHERLAFRVRLFLFLLLAAIVGAVGSIMGWAELWRQL